MQHAQDWLPAGAVGAPGLDSERPAAKSVSSAIRLLVLLLALPLAGCGPSADSASTAGHPAVVVYSSVDEVYARPVLESFTRQSGIAVQLVSDTEETKSTGLLNRLLAERARPRADVFWSGDPVRAAVLMQHGVARPYQSPQAVGLPPALSEPAGHFTCFSARARVLIYNTNLLSPPGLPTSIRDLAAPRFRGRGCLANPLFGTTSMHAAALFQQWGEAEARDFFRRLAANDVRLLASNGEVRRRVAAGEYAFGWTDSDDVEVARRDGLPVGLILPDQDSLGTLLVPNAVALIVGGPHPVGGQRLIDFLLSPGAESQLAESEAAQVPLRANLAQPAWLGRPRSELRTMTVDYVQLAARLPALQEGFLQEWVEAQTRRRTTR